MKPDLEIKKSTTYNITKGWGFERILCNNENYCGKILHFNAGAKFSLHYHLIKREHFYVLKGKLELRHKDLSNADDLIMELKEGDVIGIPVGAPHQLTAIEESDIIEVSTTHWDFDSYRVEAGDSQKK